MTQSDPNFRLATLPGLGQVMIPKDMTEEEILQELAQDDAPETDPDGAPD